MHLNIDFFKIANKKVAEKGLILISEPFLIDTYFKRTVVYLTEHTEEGSIGFVLNKPIDLKVHDVIQDFPDIDANISIGGPVNTNTIHYLHTLGDKIPYSVKINDNIYWGGDFEKIRELISIGIVTKENIRFFLGYSGWGEKQLNTELAENSWLIAEINPSMVMKIEHTGFWNEILEKMGNKYQVWANFPQNPGLN